MKNYLRSLFVIAALFLCNTSLQAKTIMIMVGAGSDGMSFSPADTTIHLGDTVMFMWVAGSHTTTSTTIPAGATTWDKNINSGSTSFSYVPTITGEYNYQCNFHFSMGMVGKFTVLPVTNVAVVNNASSFTVAPNPVSSTLHINFNNQQSPVGITIINVSGQVVFTQTYDGISTANINVEELANGIYTIKATQSGQNFIQKISIAH